MGSMRRFLPLIAALLIGTPAIAEPVYGIAMHGTPRSARITDIFLT